MNILIWTNTNDVSNNKLITGTIEKLHISKKDTVYKLVADVLSYDESSIKSYQSEITKADMVYMVYPIQWGSYPHKYKESLDKILTYGFAYVKENGSVKPLLVGKKAKTITTSAHPNEYYVEQLKAIHYLTKKTVLEFTGIESLGAINIGGRTHGNIEGFPENEIVDFIG